MRLLPTNLLFLCVGLTPALMAGPEVFDPLEAYKKLNTFATRPATETVTAGNATETAEFYYKDNLLVRAQYFRLAATKKIATGHTLYAYDNNRLVREQLFDAADNLAEDIELIYKKERLDKTLIHDVRGNAKIEWRYVYDKAGKLVAGKRIVEKKMTESFRLQPTPKGVLQNIYNAKGELTSRVESIFENGLLTTRVKSGLTGARYAEYHYNANKQLIEILYHETVRGEKTFVKKHQFDYSLGSDVQKTALAPAGAQP